MDKILAIYDSDVIYATRFSMYFKKRRELDYEISAFTKKESLMSFLEDNQIEILLLGEGIPPGDIPRDKVRWICLLSEHPPNGKCSTHLEIFKYQPARLLISEVLSGYSREGHASLTRNPKQSLQIISVFSPIPSEAKITFAWSVSMLLSERNKVLFVPMELFPVHVLSYTESNPQALSEFIYYLKENPNILSKLKELISYYGNLPYLSGLSHGYDLLAIDKEDMNRFLKVLESGSDYQIIVFYFGFYSEAVMEVLQLSDQVLVPMGNSRYEEKLLAEWRKQITLAEQQISQDKLQLVELQQDDLSEKGGLNQQELYKSSAWLAAVQVLQ